MTARRYTLLLFLLMACALAAVAAFNRVIDPFWYYRDFEIAGVNAVKPRFARFERHVKPALLVREQPEAIVLGSSFAEIGFDPLDKSLTDNGRLRSYNFAFAGADWALEQCALEFALKHAPIKRVVLGISPEALPRADCGKIWQGMDVSRAELLLSAHALDNAIRTVAEQRRARPSHTREGRYLYTRDVPGAASRFREYFKRDGAAQVRCDVRQLNRPQPIPPSAITAAASMELEGLRTVIRAALAQGAELALVVYPRHALSLELAFACGDWRARWSRIAAIAQVVAEEAQKDTQKDTQRDSVSLWVFDGYDDARGERVVGREPALWQDPEHFNYELGARMLATIYANEYGREPGFGARVLPGNVDAIFAQLLAQRERYLAATDWFYDDLRNLTAAAPAVR
jgi:hypothetical protein